MVEREETRTWSRSESPNGSTWSPKAMARRFFDRRCWWREDVRLFKVPLAAVTCCGAVEFGRGQGPSLGHPFRMLALKGDRVPIQKTSSSSAHQRPRRASNAQVLVRFKRKQPHHCRTLPEQNLFDAETPQVDTYAPA